MTSLNLDRAKGLEVATTGRLFSLFFANVKDGEKAVFCFIKILY
jgi:hypothetical protein